jgi:hypothetical protein
LNPPCTTEQDCISISRGANYRFGRDIAAGAGAIFDYNLLLQLLGQ